MNVLEHNRKAWDRLVLARNRWTVPVSEETIARARGGDWAVILTPTKPVPREWFPELTGKAVLCLASGGGQQGPVLAAAGAHVTVLDNSPAQLRQDETVAAREQLPITTIQADMADLSCFPSGSFDLVFHPCSNCFVPDVLPVWREAYRVLKRGGTLLAGFANPIIFAVDPQLEHQGILQLRYSIPYSDLTSLTPEARDDLTAKGEALTFGHTLESQIGGQLQAGFALTGLYEDSWEQSPLHGFLDAYVATRAVKA